MGVFSWRIAGSQGQKGSKFQGKVRPHRYICLWGASERKLKVLSMYTDMSAVCVCVCVCMCKCVCMCMCVCDSKHVH